MSTPFEVQGVSMLTVASVLLRDTVMVCLVGKSLPFRFKLPLDIFLLVTPVMLGFTILCMHWHILLVMMVLISILIIIQHIVRLGKNITAIDIRHQLLASPMLTNRPAINHTRAYLLISTAISILAVDFIVFPRKFTKTVGFGTTLMDVGVGCFVFLSNGMVSPEGRGKTDRPMSIDKKVHVIKQALLSSGALFIIGTLRLVSMFLLHERIRISEYGTHWNFYFTLAVVKVISSTILSFIPPRFSWCLALTISCIYQLLLSKFSLTQILLLGEWMREMTSSMLTERGSSLPLAISLSILPVSSLVDFCLSKRERCCPTG